MVFCTTHTRIHLAGLAVLNQVVDSTSSGDKLDIRIIEKVGRSFLEERGDVSIFPVCVRERERARER